MENCENFITHIILHHSLTKDSGTVSTQAIRNYHVFDRGWRNIGYHYIIEIVNDYPEIFVGRMMTETGAHTRGLNQKSIGICIVGNFDKKKPSKILWNKAIKLVKSLKIVFNIPIDNVIGHREYKKTKSCPGFKFNMDKFREDLGG